MNSLVLRENRRFGAEDVFLSTPSHRQAQETLSPANPSESGPSFPPNGSSFAIESESYLQRVEGVV
jgi:hypothetical protein